VRKLIQNEGVEGLFFEDAEKKKKKQWKKKKTKKERYAKPADFAQKHFGKTTKIKKNKEIAPSKFS